MNANVWQYLVSFFFEPNFTEKYVIGDNSRKLPEFLRNDSLIIGNVIFKALKKSSENRKTEI